MPFKTPKKTEKERLRKQITPHPSKPLKIRHGFLQKSNVSLEKNRTTLCARLLVYTQNSLFSHGNHKKTLFHLSLHSLNPPPSSFCTDLPPCLQEAIRAVNLCNQGSKSSKVHVLHHYLSLPNQVRYQQLSLHQIRHR
jgi:hypothetical protein